jgi:cystathionine beta-lyase/cystathionine gamma-synthase
MHDEQDAILPWNIDTLLVHGGQLRKTGNDTGTPTIQPIYASTTYHYADIENLDKAFDSIASTGEPAFVYARQANPNAHAFETVVAQAEGGVGAIALGSGMAAIHTALLAAGLVSGTKIVASKDMYGPTVSLLQKVFAPTGVEIVLSDLCCINATEFIHKEQPDVIYVETISNPLVKMVDLDAISAAAREVGAVTIVDSTFTTPCLLRPIEHGFDLVVHSATKYMSGHGDSTGGVVVSAKNALLDQLRSYAILLGAMLSPFEAHLMMRGLRTMALRMERHCYNALQVARFLEEHPVVARVYYPGLATHPQHALAGTLLKNELYGGLLAFELKAQSREAVYRFMNHLKLCMPVTTLGDVFSEVSYPAMSSHRTLTVAERDKMGITEGCIRLSVGIEYIDDIMQDLDQALAYS